MKKKHPPIPHSLPGKPKKADLLDKASALYRQNRFVQLQTLLAAASPKPAKNTAFLNLAALAAVSTSQTHQTEQFWRQALRHKPNYPEAHWNLGNLLLEQQRYKEAEACYRQALSFKPDSPKVLYQLALLLKEQQRFDEAETSLKRAIKLKSDYYEAHSTLGAIYAELHHDDEAIICFHQALALKENYREAHDNLIYLLQKLHRVDEAEDWLRLDLSHNPNSVSAYLDLAALLINCRRYVEAEALCRQALSIAPDNLEAHYSLSFLLLSLAQFAEGWQEYEIARAEKIKALKSAAPEYFSALQWQGESLQGKTIVLWSEHGLGDQIQFCRYVDLLKGLGAAQITLVCAKPLRNLFKTLVQVDAIISLDDLSTLGVHDYWSLLLSLPLYCGTLPDNIPAALPYLQATEDRKNHWLPILPKFGAKVGLVWKGSIDHKNDSNRSLPGLEALEILWHIPGITFISLQKGQSEAETAAKSANQPIIALGSRLADFADSAAIISQLDLVICVDTAIAHLAGALAKPCWLLLPAIHTDWRWQRERSDSPWYPGVMRLFRQQTPGEWRDVVNEINAALTDWIQQWQPLEQRPAEAVVNPDKIQEARFTDKLKDLLGWTKKN